MNKIRKSSSCYLTINQSEESPRADPAPCYSHQYVSRRKSIFLDIREVIFYLSYSIFDLSLGTMLILELSLVISDLKGIQKQKRMAATDLTEAWPRGATPHPRSGACMGTGGLRGATTHSRSGGAAMRRYLSSKVRSCGPLC